MDSRDWSPDRGESRVVRHQHSFSENGRTSVPMWDSSDPDRAPPPLPLNPGAVNNSPITKPHVSSNIEKAAALIASRALESTPSSYTSNPPPNGSPERNLMKSHHKRMQSMQTGSIGRLSDSLERRSPDKGLSRAKRPELEEFRANRSYERSPTRAASNTPILTEEAEVPRKLFSDENSPQTPGMIALQSVRNRQDAETPLKDITNSGTETKADMSLGSLSNQILHITSIATNLQKEMSNLSRRSKDNASDLSSLREATNVRDEDIRKSLRELVSSLDTKFTSIDSRILGNSEASRSTPNLAMYGDDPHLTPTRKTINFPRVTSPSLLDRDITASPSVVSVDGAASIALLEKVLREMGTRDGQDKIMNTLENVKSYADRKSTQNTSQKSTPVIDPDMSKKLEEILIFMKDMKEESGSKALVKSNSSNLGRSPSQIDMYLEKTGQMTKIRHDEERRSSGMSAQGSDLLSDDILKTLKSVKQSLSHNGGLTNEVKTIIRELRGEVLGMGREIGRKLENADLASRDFAQNDTTGLTAAEVTNIVEQSFAELKEQMHCIVQESQQSLSSSQHPPVDTNEIVRAVQTAVINLPAASQNRNTVAEREEMMVAIKEAWDDCKPEIALEHFGLERDEILETLKEGLLLYQNESQRSVKNNGVTYEEVVEAVRKELQNFQIPPLQTETNITREEILDTIRDCLDNHTFPASTVPSHLTGSELSRDEIVDAVREVLAVQTNQPSSENAFTKDEMVQAMQEGFSAHAHVTKEIDFNRDDLFDAIKACLEGEQNPLGGMGERVVDAMHEFLGSMRTEFQQYSAANGRDTEQVLDALKDGLEELRADVESYVDRAADVTGKDEIIDTVKSGFAAMQMDIEKGFNSRMQNSNNTTEVLDAMDKEFEHLRETINKSLARINISSDREDILEAIREINDDRQSSITSGSEDIVRHVKEELEHMRTTLAATLVRGSSSLEREDVLDAIREGLETSRGMPRADGNESILSNTSELLDAFQEGVDGIRSDLQKLTSKSTDLSTNFEILDTLKDGIENVRADIERLQNKQYDNSDSSTSRGQEVMLHEGSNIASEIEGLKVMITQLRIKVEALDNMPVPEPVIPSEIHMHKDDLDDLHSAIRGIHDSVNSMPRQTAPEVVMPTGAAMKDDTDAIETLLRNVKAKLDDLAMPDTESLAKSSHLLSIEDMLRDVKDSVDGSFKDSRDQNMKEDFTIIELLLKDVRSGIEGLQARTSNGNAENLLSKTDLEVLESICLETKDKLDAFSLPGLDSLANKDDLGDIKDTIQALREQFEADNDLTAQAFEARKIEHGGLATKIDDVKTLIADIREELVGKLNGSEEGIVELAKVLGMHHDNMNAYATASSVAELSDLVSQGFESHMEHHTNNKSEMEVRDATLFDKHEQTSNALKSDIEEKFNELMTKYDDAQLANEAKLNSMDERDKSHLDATAGVKTIVDDLKSIMNTLGSTVTESCEKMTADARTVYDKVDDANNKIGELHTANAYEHGMTRDELAKVLTAATRVEGSLESHQPAILAAVREILGVVGQHYEHSQQHSETFRAAAEEIKSGVNAIPSAIPPLLPPPETSRSMPSSSELPDQKDYDDSVVRSKLDELLLHASSAREALVALESGQMKPHESLNGLYQLSHLEKLDGLGKLDEIQQQVRDTADEISLMVATQTRLMAEDHDNKVVEAREAAIALEKRVAQKETVEVEIVALTREKNQLAESMAALRAEHEQLSAQTKQLSREVGKLETALNIRQEEMRDMNSRAESLERRVLEGVMNHARSLRFAKPLSKKISPAERDASMNLKRVPSTSSNATAKASSPRGKGSALGSAVGMALKKRQPLGGAVNPAASPRVSMDRRILSTSHVTGSRLSETPRALVLAPSPTSNLANLKRSHSVKSNPSSYLSGRKASWNGTESFVSDKENQDGQGEEGSDNDSDAGTERRTSYTGTYADSIDYQTGSSVSRSSLRSASYASSIGGTLNGQQDSILEEDEDDAEEQEDEEELEERQGDKEESDVQDASGALVLAEEPIESHNLGVDTQIVRLEAEDELGDLPDHDQFQRHEPKYSVPSDSGIGSEPLTPEVIINQSSQSWNSTVST